MIGLTVPVRLSLPELLRVIFALTDVVPAIIETPYIFGRTTASRNSPFVLGRFAAGYNREANRPRISASHGCGGEFQLTMKPLNTPIRGQPRKALAFETLAEKFAACVASIR